MHSENSAIPAVTPLVTAAFIISALAFAIAASASNLALALASVSVAHVATSDAHACQSAPAASVFALASSNAAWMSIKTSLVPSCDLAPGAGNAETHAAGSVSVKQVKQSDAEVAHFFKSEVVFSMSDCAFACACWKQSWTSDAHT